MQLEFRVKRDTPQSPPPPLPSLSSATAHPASSPAGSIATSNAAATATVPAAITPGKGSQLNQPKIENPPRLLGVNGTGQRKDYSAINDTKPVALPPSTPAQPSTNAEIKSSTINKSLGATQANPNRAIEEVVGDIEDKLIGDIDESEEEINKTVNAHLADEHLASQVSKTDYFQYYNSTTVIDKNKSDEYWSQKKDYIISSILSKSHRRAIVSKM